MPQRPCPVGASGSWARRHAFVLSTILVVITVPVGIGDGGVIVPVVLVLALAAGLAE